MFIILISNKIPGFLLDVSVDAINIFASEEHLVFRLLTYERGCNISNLIYNIMDGIISEVKI